MEILSDLHPGLQFIQPTKYQVRPLLTVYDLFDCINKTYRHQKYKLPVRFLRKLLYSQKGAGLRAYNMPNFRVMHTYFNKATSTNYIYSKPRSSLK